MIFKIATEQVSLNFRPPQNKIASYDPDSCMENVRQIIKKDNNYVSREKPKSTPSCNCRKKDICPMNGNCLMNNVIYKCTVFPATRTKQRAYLGLAEGEWKQRYYNHN